MTRKAHKNGTAARSVPVRISVRPEPSVPVTMREECHCAHGRLAHQGASGTGPCVICASIADAPPCPGWRAKGEEGHHVDAA